MKVLVYGQKNEYEECALLLSALPVLQYRRMEFFHAEDYDSFIGLLPEMESEDPVVILTDGAEGMEGVLAAKRQSPALPVFWFSNDKGFGVQSHRLECTFFAVKPLTEQKMQAAIEAYQKERIG